MGNPREHIRDKGFWDGGAPGHGRDNESAGRPGGTPGTRKPQRVGVRTDIEFPPEEPAAKDEPKT